MQLRQLALACPFLIVAAGFAWETVAVAAPQLGMPSWSEIVTSRISGRPSVAWVQGALVGVGGTMLGLHFARALPWWRP